MLSYESFGENVEAHLLYAYSLPPGDGLEILKRRLEDGGWCTAPGAWLARFRNLVHLHQLADDRRARELRALFVDAIVSGEVGQEAHETLRELFLGPESTADEAKKIASWFIDKAGPGDASLAADVLFAASLSEDDAQQDAVRPLAAWLVEHGASELRSRRRLDLLFRLLRMFGTATMLGPVLRYIIVNEENALGLQSFANDPDGLIRSAVERVLEQEPRSSVACELALKLGSFFAQTVLDPPAEAPACPRFQRALLVALARGSWPTREAVAAWSAAFWCACPGDLSFASSDAIDAAIDALKQHVALGDRRSRSSKGGDAKNDRAWARLLAAEFARIHELADGLPRAARDRLYACVGHTDAATEGIGEALRIALHDRPGLARDLLAESASTGVVASAIIALPDFPGANRRRGLGDEVDIAEVGAVLTRLVNWRWTEPVYGVDVARALGSTSRVELADLANDDKVIVEDGVAKLDRESVKGMLRALDMNREAKLALACMYFIHELVHVEQGIGDKALVSALRSTGGETTLMHVDLAADHTAALCVAKAIPKWRLEWLKDLQGQSLVAFPASPLNTTAGRARKSQRLVGLRIDYFARVTGAIPRSKIGDGYAFGDYGPAGGKLLVMVSGPPVALVRAADLSPNEATLLSGAADDGLDATRLAEIDRVLVEKLGSSRS